MVLWTRWESSWCKISNNMQNWDFGCMRSTVTEADCVRNSFWFKWNHPRRRRIYFLQTLKRRRVSTGIWRGRKYIEMLCDRRRFFRKAARFIWIDRKSESYYRLSLTSNEERNLKRQMEEFLFLFKGFFYKKYMFW